MTKFDPGFWDPPLKQKKYHSIDREYVDHFKNE